jgi:glycosyltransferase involved in cell wall biosynthesis
MSNVAESATPSVSVIIAAFNAEATLGKQLAALARQRAPFGYEVLVCDNGSSDGTVALSQSWADRVSLRVVDASARQGASAARNVGAAVARAPRLTFCDADDVVSDDWLAEMVDALQSADLVGGGSGYALLNRPALGRQDWEDPLLRKPQAPSLVGTSSSNLGIRADVFSKVGGFDEMLFAAEDFDLCWRVQFAGYRVAARPSAFVNLRRRDSWSGVFRQGFAWGAGDRALRRKYGDLRGYRAAVPAEPIAQPWPPVGKPGDDARGGLMGKLGRLRGPRDLDFLVARAGIALGAAFGPVDRGIHPVEFKAVQR